MTHEKDALVETVARALRLEGFKFSYHAACVVIPLIAEACAKIAEEYDERDAYSGLIAREIRTQLAGATKP